MSTSFIRFPSITNHYQSKFIQKMLEFHPGLQNERFLVTEKLHGANLQIYFEPGQPYRVGSRNQWLDSNSKFFNVWNALDRVSPVLTSAWDWAYREQKSLRLFEELYGGNIQDGTDYGPEQNIRFFAAMIDDRLISPDALLSLGITSLLRNFVPILSTSMTWKTAMDFDIDRDSILTPDDHEGPNLIEGVVIQPYNHVYRLPCGSSFVLKRKNPEFLTHKKPAKAKIAMGLAIVELRVEFLDYITEARVDSIISQNGPFTEIQQLGTYIVLVLNDAKRDFALNHVAMDILDKKARKYIFNVGGIIANMLKTRL